MKVEAAAFFAAIVFLQQNQSKLVDEPVSTRKENK